MIQYQMTPNVMEVELNSAGPKMKMDSINHSNAFFRHHNEDLLKKEMEFSCFFLQSGYESLHSFSPNLLND